MAMNTDNPKNQKIISNYNQLEELLKEGIQMLKKEREVGEIGAQKLSGGLVNIFPEGSAIIVGDIHGDLDSLTTILKKSQSLERLNKEKIYLIFLGDYGDRGEYTPEVYWAILRLKISYPKNIILLRGNHEPAPGLDVYPFDLPNFLLLHYGNKGFKLMPLFESFFNFLPQALLVKGKYLMLHGGLPEKISCIEDIANAHQTHPTTSYLEQILWSDPGNNKGSHPSPRGAGRVFGEDISQKILALLNLKTLIRSHQPCEGTSIAHQGKVLTLFSCKGEPYHNTKAAYLDLDLSLPAKDAYQLHQEAHLF